jgi:hypothetical protein
MRLLVGIGISLLATVLIIGGLNCGGVGRPVNWEIPAGYIGWIVVQYKDSSCPPLRSDGLYLDVDITSAGTACTSTDDTLKVWRYNRFEYIDQDGVRTEIPIDAGPEQVAVRAESVNTRRNNYTFFVGTAADVRSLEQSRPLR